MSDCIGTGCKADALMQRIMAITAERDALAALLRDLRDGDHVYGNDSEPMLIRIDAALAKEKP